MRRTVAAVSVVAVSVLGLSGCGGSTEEFCALEDDFDQLEQGEASLNDARDAMDELQDTAPDEISDDVDTIVSAFNEYLDALEETGVDPDSAIAEVPEPTEDVQAALERLSSDEVSEAGDNVTAFVDENCNSES